MRGVDSGPFTQFDTRRRRSLHDVFIGPQCCSTLGSGTERKGDQVLIKREKLNGSTAVRVLFRSLGTGKALPLLVAHCRNVPLDGGGNCFLCGVMRSLAGELSRRLCGGQGSTGLLSGRRGGHLSCLIRVFCSSRVTRSCLGRTGMVGAGGQGVKLSGFFGGGLGLVGNIIDKTVGMASSIIQRDVKLPRGSSMVAAVPVFRRVPVGRVGDLSVGSMISGNGSGVLTLLGRLMSVTLDLGCKSVMILFSGVSRFSRVGTSMGGISRFALRVLASAGLLCAGGLSVMFDL